MPAMHDLVLSAMNDRLEHWRNVMLRTQTFDMTHEECIHLVAPSDHVDVLTSAARYARLNASEDWFFVTVPAAIDGYQGQLVQLQMRTHAGKEPPLVPRHPQWQRGQSGEKVIAWMNQRYEIGRRFGTARYVLYTLARECTTGQQVRYLWPAVMHLCWSGGGEKMERWVEKFAAYRPVKHAPVISPALKRAIADSSALLTSMALIGDDVPTPIPGEVQISHYVLPTFTLDPLTGNGPAIARM